MCELLSVPILNTMTFVVCGSILIIDLTDVTVRGGYVGKCQSLYSGILRFETCMWKFTLLKNVSHLRFEFTKTEELFLRGGISS